MILEDALIFTFSGHHDSIRFTEAPNGVLTVQSTDSRLAVSDRRRRLPDATCRQWHIAEVESFDNNFASRH